MNSRYPRPPCSRRYTTQDILESLLPPPLPIRHNELCQSYFVSESQRRRRSGPDQITIEPDAVNKRESTYPDRQ